MGTHGVRATGRPHVNHSRRLTDNVGVVVVVVLLVERDMLLAAVRPHAYRIHLGVRVGSCSRSGLRIWFGLDHLISRQRDHFALKLRDKLQGQGDGGLLGPVHLRLGPG